MTLGEAYHTKGGARGARPDSKECMARDNIFT